MSRCWWIDGLLVLVYCPYDWASYFLVTWLALWCVYNSVNCLAVICSLNIVVYHLLGERDITSERDDSPVHIFIIVYTVPIYCFYFPFSCNYYFHPCFLSFVNSKAGEIDNLSELIGSKVICVLVCRSTSTPRQKWISGTVVTYLLLGILLDW